MRVAFRQFVGVVSELEKSFITMRLSAGRQKKATEGRYAGGGIPLGYKLTQDKDLMVDEADADTIMLIFKLRRKHWNLLQIADRLNVMDIPTARVVAGTPAPLSTFWRTHDIKAGQCTAA